MGIGAVVVLQRQSRRDVHILHEVQLRQQGVRRLLGGGGGVALRRRGKAALIGDDGQIDVSVIAGQVAVIELLELQSGVVQGLLIISRLGGDGVALVHIHVRKRRTRRFLCGDPFRRAEHDGAGQQHKDYPFYNGVSHAWTASS